MRVALLLAAVAIWASVAYAQLPTCASVQLGTIYSNTTARSFTQLTSAGWTACYAQRFDVPMGATAAAAKAACAGYTHLLVACGVFGRSELITSSAAPASVIFNPVPFTSSGDDFGQGRYYYTDTYNMGFLPAGGTTTRSQTVCDTTDGSSSERLCLHLSNLVGGGRCGDAERIGANSGNLRKVIMGFNCNPPPTNCTAEVLYKPCDRTRRVSAGKSVAFGFSSNDQENIPCTPPQDP